MLHLQKIIFYRVKFESYLYEIAGQLNVNILNSKITKNSLYKNICFLTVGDDKINISYSDVKKEVLLGFLHNHVILVNEKRSGNIKAATSLAAA